MKKTINILSNNVINQIAAGEVVKRPSSVVKELLENSIDAQSSCIHLVIKNAGKNLIQVIDDGIGMSKEDAEICFLKHSTSKINDIDDIFNISTMGFRGEALASISSIAELDIKTRMHNHDTGTVLIIDNSTIKKISETSTKKGTSISVKNIFFNIPARKKFLKSNQVEFKHILDVFHQISIAHSNIEFKLINNKVTIYNLKKTNLKQRIIDLFGKRYNKKILPISETTSIVKISGFIGNPLDSKKTRGEQYLYVNNRYVKSNYLNHAIKSSMDNLINSDKHPSYFIFLSIDSSLIDINIHPNKTEVKFEDEKSIYQILHASCKKSIGIHNITPSLDFTSESSFEIPIHTQKKYPKEPTIQFNNQFNPFKTKYTEEEIQQTNKLFSQNIEANDKLNTIIEVMHVDHIFSILKINKNGVNTINLVHKQFATQRIIYEETKKKLETAKTSSQLMISPVQILLNKSDLTLIKENKKTIQSYGFNISIINNDFIEFDSIPHNILEKNIIDFIESFLEEIKNNNPNIKSKLTDSLARNISINKTKNKSTYNFSSNQALIDMVNKLLKCENPFMSIHHCPCLINIEPNNFFK